MKQPLANMQWAPMSTRSTAATCTPRLRNEPSPIRMRAGAIAVSQTSGSKRTCGPSSSRPSWSISSTLPCSGQRANASRRASSQWMRARFQGSELRSYQRHFCAHSLSRAGSMGGPVCPPQPGLQVVVRLRGIVCLPAKRAKTGPMRFARSLLAVTPLLLLAAAAPAGAAVPHTVQPGETLWSIAAANNLTTRTVAAFNGLPETANVVLGSTVNVPTTVEGASALINAGVQLEGVPPQAGAPAPATASAPPPAPAPAAAAGGAPPAAGGYVVRAGDTL